MGFTNKVAVVTGAGSGIGQAVARKLVEQGATVFGIDVNVDAVPEGVHPLRADVSDVDNVERAVIEAAEAGGRIDILCNLAGISTEGGPADTRIEDWDRAFAINVRGIFLATRAVVPHMLAAGGGAIVNAGSTAAHIGIKDRSAYCASKGAVEAFTRQVAVQYAAEGVRCNAVSPGPVDSPMVQALYARSDDPKAAAERNAARVPVGRLARPDEIADAILYLASDEAAFVTGASLSIDGGLVAG